MTKIEAGKYEAKIVNYGVGETKSGDPQIKILFGYSDKDGDYHEITWFGMLKAGKSQEITLKALLTCGMSGNDIEGLADGPSSGLLDMEKKVQIDIGENTYNGKTNMRVNWINPLSKFETAFGAKSKLAGLNLKGALMAARAETGIKDEPRKPVKHEAESDIPF